jgi:hypothetical protein
VGTAGNLGAVADLDVADQTGMTAHDDVIAKLGRARNADLAYNHAVAPHHHVVPDLDEIINFRAFADDGILKSAAIDG